METKQLESTQAEKEIKKLVKLLTVTYRNLDKKLNVLTGEEKERFNKRFNKRFKNNMVIFIQNNSYPTETLTKSEKEEVAYALDSANKILGFLEKDFTVYTSKFVVEAICFAELIKDSILYDEQSIGLLNGFLREYEFVK